MECISLCSTRFFRCFTLRSISVAQLAHLELRPDLDVVVVVRPRLELAGRRHEPLRVADRILLPVGAVPHQLLHTGRQLRERRGWK